MAAPQRREPGAPKKLCFGAFEADVEIGVLSKHGRKVRLQSQPFQVLAYLLQHPGSLVTRSELQRAVWPAEVFVDFEYGLNTAIKKVRYALGDSAENPRFIETIPRQGYRFIAPVSAASEASDPLPAAADSHSRRILRRLTAAGALATVMAAAGWWLRPRTTGETAWPEPLTSYPGVELEPAFSPDGSSIAFPWLQEREPFYHIYTKRLDADNPVKLTNGAGDDCSPSWSPDGRLIAFYRYHTGADSQVLIIPASGGAETSVAASSVVMSANSRPFLTWAPDGRSLVITHNQEKQPNVLTVSAASAIQRHPSSLFLLSIDTGQLRKLTFAPDDSIGDSAPAFSPDGRSLAFARTTGPAVADIYVVRVSPQSIPAETPRRLTSSNEFAASPAWTSDGREIVFSTGAPGRDGPAGRSRLRRIAADGGSGARELEFAGDHVSFPAISRRGQLSYAQLTRDANIWSAKLRAPGETAAAPFRMIGSTRLDATPRFSPDGKRVAFISDRSGSMEIWAADADGSNSLQLTNMRARMTSSPAWAPDQSRIIFESDKGGRFHLYIMSAAGGIPQLLADMPGDNAAAAFSGDGRWIYFTSNRSGAFQIWKMPAAGGPAVQMTKNGGRMAVESPDGKFVYYTTAVMDGKQNALWRVPVSGGGETPVLPSVGPFNFAVAKAGIYFTRWAGAGPPYEMQFFSFDTGNTARVFLLSGAPAGGVSVAPDGRTLLYAQEDGRGADLMLVRKFQ